LFCCIAFWLSFLLHRKALKWEGEYREVPGKTVCWGWGWDQRGRSEFGCIKNNNLHNYLKKKIILGGVKHCCL
jgi:hypothetical protein